SPEAVTPEASGALSRLGRWLPRLAGLRRFTNRTAAVSAASAGVLWWALARGLLDSGGGWLVALVLLAVLLLPAGAAWLLGLTLHDIMTLPERLRSGAVAAAAQSREALAGTPEAGGRLFGTIRAIWAARGFVLESKGAWAKAATAVRVVRLAKLPFVLGLLGLFAFNLVVILGGLLALALLVL
ncbi:MAG: hypothetical protein AAFQ43_10855, partial [Bacteroidota bacterium]